MNNRERMRESNLLVRKYLLENNFDHIWFKPHTKRSEYVFTQNGKYLATDLWNLFDGICFTEFGGIVFLQMKTNSWAKEKPIKDFLKKTHDLRVMSFNVTNKMKECNGHYKVFVRKYQ